jgi:hypothetical protein
VTKKTLKLASSPSAASDQITEHARRQITDYVLADGVRHQAQQLANIQERKRPGTIIGCEPAVGIEIKFSLNRARRAVEPTQILLGLFENSGRQILLSCLARAIIGGVHIVVRLFIPSQAFERRYFRKSEGFFARSACCVPICHGFCARTKAEQQDNQETYKWSEAHRVPLSSAKNRQGSEGKQNSDQRARDGKPERDVPA